MTTDGDNLLAAILANPEDDLPRREIAMTDDELIDEASWLSTDDLIRLIDQLQNMVNRRLDSKRQKDREALSKMQERARRYVPSNEHDGRNCPTCQGMGSSRGTGFCSTCEGEGYVREVK